MRLLYVVTFVKPKTLSSVCVSWYINTQQVYGDYYSTIKGCGVGKTTGIEALGKSLKAVIASSLFILKHHLNSSISFPRNCQRGGSEIYFTFWCLLLLFYFNFSRKITAIMFF